MIHRSTFFLLGFLCLLLTSCSPKRNTETKPVETSGFSEDTIATILPKEPDETPVFTVPFSIEEEYKKHDSAIAADPHLGHVIDDPNSSFKAATAFSRYVQENLLYAPSDYRFIADRKLLSPFETLHCNDDSVILSGNMMGGEPVLIKLLFTDFKPKEHRIIYEGEVGDMIESIDEKPVHGTHFEVPKRAISEIKFCIGEEEFTAPEAAFQNLYEFYLCKGSGFDRPIQAFTSMNQEYVYLYFVGGNASDTYFGKLVFNQEAYITRIISDYYPLHLHSSFHDDFIGF